MLYCCYFILCINCSLVVANQFREQYSMNMNDNETRRLWMVTNVQSAVTFKCTSYIQK